MPELMKQPEPMPYLTVIPGRHPEQKLHKRLSDAKSAFSTEKFNINAYQAGWTGTTHGWGQLYQMVDGQWVLLYDVPQPTDEHAHVVERTWGTYQEYESRPWKIEG